MRLRTVKTLNEVIHNVLHFNGDFCADSQVVARLAHFRHWYHVPLLGLFGPGKIIGHVKQDGETVLPLMATEYLKHAEALDNLDPEPTLREWFRSATEDEAFRLQLELAYALGQYGREPNGTVHIYVLKHH
jgi:hypothetical protein